MPDRERLAALSLATRALPAVGTRLGSVLWPHRGEPDMARCPHPRSRPHPSGLVVHPVGGVLASPVLVGGKPNKGQGSSVAQWSTSWGTAVWGQLCAQPATPHPLQRVRRDAPGHPSSCAQPSHPRLCPEPKPGQISRAMPLEGQTSAFPSGFQPCLVWRAWIWSSRWKSRVLGLTTKTSTHVPKLPWECGCEGPLGALRRGQPRPGIATGRLCLLLLCALPW